jgi:hypothetical protein
MNAEPKIEQATQEQPKSKRLSSLIWILLLWGGVRLFSELHPIYWTHLFFYSAIGLGLPPATISFLLSMCTKNKNTEKAFRWTAVFILLIPPVFGFILQELGINDIRKISIVMQWVLLLVGISSTYWLATKKGNVHEH